MRTHGHREGSITHWSPLGGIGEGQWGGELGRDSNGEKCQMWVKGRKTANHTATCVPMQLSCMFCTIPQNLKCNKKKKPSRLRYKVY